MPPPPLAAQASAGSRSIPERDQRAGQARDRPFPASKHFMDGFSEALRAARPATSARPGTGVPLTVTIPSHAALSGRK
jgi:hypothetical protein